MPTLEEIVEVVEMTLEEEDISTDFITKRINEGLRYCAREVRLPSLETYGTFNTTVDSYQSGIPDSWNYHRGLYSAEASDARFIEIASSISNIKSKYLLDETARGPVSVIAISAETIFYFPIPTEATEITCRFYKLPDKLIKDSDKVTCLPESLASSILENFALWKCYKIIEDEQEGQRVNTRHYRRAFLDDLEILDSHIEEGQSAPEPIRHSVWI